MFKDREDAGRKLAIALRPLEQEKPIILAIPRGGIPVGFEVARGLGAELDFVTARKLPIPWNREAGFGAIAPDGSIYLNEPLVEQLALSRATIERIAEEVLKEIQRREKLFRAGKGPLHLGERTVILVDDGLASGYTMLAALKFVRRMKAKRVVVAVPCAPQHTVQLVRSQADDIVCLETSQLYPFAVASFYQRWWDLTDEEVLHYIEAPLKREGEEKTK